MYEGDLATGPGGAVTQMRVGVLAYPGCFGSQIYSIPDLLTIAAHVAPAAEAPRIVVMSPRRHVTAAGGLRIAVSPLREVDVLVVPGFETGRAPAFATVLSQLRPEIAAIQDLRAQGTRVVSICVGAFLLAEAGLLTGRDATTSWLYAHDLAQAYPTSTSSPNKRWSALEQGHALPRPEPRPALRPQLAGRHRWSQPPHTATPLHQRNAADPVGIPPASQDPPGQNAAGRNRPLGRAHQSLRRLPRRGNLRQTLPTTHRLHPRRVPNRLQSRGLRSK
jgi:putative intracellular protease/amidase